MGSKRLYFAAILISIIAFSCEDIFEKDLAKEQVSILAPGNNYQTTTLTQTFWWEDIKDAINYNLQVVSPSFSSIQQLVLDTNITDNLFTYTLQPGQYQWRVKAMNGSSSTAYVTYSLTIDTTSDLSNQVVLLEQPANNSYANTLNNTFTWSGLSNATFYNLQMAYTSFAFSSNIFLDTMVTDNNFNYSFVRDSTYQWRVRALNSTGASLFSNPYNLTVDVTAPNAPTLLLPEHLDTITAPFTMYWDRGNVSGSPVSDSLYIYSDSLTTLINSFHTTVTNHGDSLGIGNYFWRVRSQDAAGNIGPYSATGKFTIQ